MIEHPYWPTRDESPCEVLDADGNVCRITRPTRIVGHVNNHTTPAVRFDMDNFCMSGWDYQGEKYYLAWFQVGFKLYFPVDQSVNHRGMM